MRAAYLVMFEARPVIVFIAEMSLSALNISVMDEPVTATWAVTLIPSFVLNVMVFSSGLKVYSPLAFIFPIVVEYVPFSLNVKMHLLRPVLSYTLVKLLSAAEEATELPAFASKSSFPLSRAQAGALYFHVPITDCAVVSLLPKAVWASPERIDLISWALPEIDNENARMSVQISVFFIVS